MVFHVVFAFILMSELCLSLSLSDSISTDSKIHLQIQTKHQKYIQHIIPFKIVVASGILSS